MILLIVALIAPGAAQAANQRPISDFVNAQGTFEGPLFVPPIRNFVGWGDPDSGLFASVDYAGLADLFITDFTEGAITFNTTFDGKVTERPLRDGRTEVHVILKTSNALTWVFDTADFPGDSDDPFNEVPLVFGARVPEILEGAEPALGDSKLEIIFIHNQPVGGDLPDLIQLMFSPNEGEEIKFVAFHSKTLGSLNDEEGTPARVMIQQKGITNPSGKDLFDPNSGAFSVEFVKLK